MNRKTRTLVRTMLMLLIIAAGLAVGVQTNAAPLGTAFTYQGQLKQGGVPADGDYDFVFRFFDTASGPSQVGSDEPVNDWPVTDGLFSVQIDFGTDVFTGNALWLEVAVRPGDNDSDHLVLSPRQPVTATPYALYALDGLDSTDHWAVSGDDVYNTNNGKVGVGTAEPSGSLHVTNDGETHAIWAETTDIAVLAYRTALTGSWPAVHGDCASASNGSSGVRGYVTNDDPGALAAGVYGYCTSTEPEASDAVGVRGRHAGSGTGIYGQSIDGTGVYGHVTDTAGYAGYFQGGRNYFEGNVGIGTDAPGAPLDVGNRVRIGVDSGAGWITTMGPYGWSNARIRNAYGDPSRSIISVDHAGGAVAFMYVDESYQGVIGADVKSFRVPHPDNPAEDIWYACVEGPEAAMYVRGTGKLVDGRGTIELPEHFRVLAVEDSMTVDLTPLSLESKGMAVARKSLDGLDVDAWSGPVLVD